jgi:hypothetical protein
MRMKWIVEYIKPIMLVSGALTCTMIYAAVAPQVALSATFGETLDGPLATLLVRNWAILITLMGVLLIYGAYRPESRVIAILVAGGSKLAFILLVLAHGTKYLNIAAAIDAIWIVVFGCYLVAVRSELVAARA